MTVERGFVHKTIAELIQIAVLKERRRCADLIAIYPLDNFSYAGDTGELLRLRDTLSEALLKGSLPGEMIS